MKKIIKKMKIKLKIKKINKKISPKILILEARDRCHSVRLRKLRRIAVVSVRYLFKLGRKNISENIDPRASGPVPFDAAWEKKYLRKY